MPNKIIILILIALFAIPVFGQEQIGALNNLGGLNTASSPFTIKATDARIAHNVDFSRTRGAICPRYGYDSISVLNEANIDSIIDIFAIQYSDGSERLVFITDTTRTSVIGGWGNVYATSIGSTNLDSATRIAIHFPINGIISASIYKDVLYLSSSTARGLVWNGTHAQEWPMNAPGEPTVVPVITGSANTLKGEYRYLFAYRRIRRYDPNDVGVFVRDTFYTPYGGYISRPVQVDGNQIFLTNFAKAPQDSSWVDGLGLETSEWFTEVLVYRTKGDVGPIDKYDTAYYTGQIVNISASVYSRLVDSVQDADLPVAGTGAGSEKFPATMLVVDPNYRGVSADTTQVPYGASQLWDTYDTTKTSATDVEFGIIGRDTTQGGSELGYARIDSAITGWMYACSFADTLLGLESDTGRSLMIRTDIAIPKKGYEIHVPRVSWDDTTVVVNIYKAPMFVLSFDTAFSFYYRGDPCSWTGGYVWNDVAQKMIKEFDCSISAFEAREIDRRINTLSLGEGREYISFNLPLFIDYRYWLTPDSFYVGGFNKIGVATPASDSDVVFIDTTLRLDSVRDRPPLSLRYVPPFLSSTFLFDGKLYGVSGDGVFFSYLDSVATFGVFNQIALSVFDGENITLAFPARGGVRAFKPNKSFMLWQDASLGWSRQEIAGGVGCVAPNSYALHATGHYYLSSFGLVRENEGEFLERRQKYDFLSKGRLTNFDTLSAATLKKANAIIFDDQYMLSIGDTTFVYDIIEDKWSTWNMPFKKAVVYRNSGDYSALHGDSMFFIQPNSKNLYQYKKGNQDVSGVSGGTVTDVDFVWKSAELAAGRDWVTSSAVGLWFTDSLQGSTYGVKTFTESQDTTTTTTFSALPIQQRYLEKWLPRKLSRYFQYQITSDTDTSGVGIYGIVPIITKQGSGIRK